MVGASWESGHFLPWDSAGLVQGQDGSALAYGCDEFRTGRATIKEQKHITILRNTSFFGSLFWVTFFTFPFVDFVVHPS